MYSRDSGSVISRMVTIESFSMISGTDCRAMGRESDLSVPPVLIFRLIIDLLSVFYNLIHVFGEGGLRAYLVLIATAPRKPAFSHGVVQTVAAVAIFFFVNVTDGKPPFRQTQIFNNYFFEKNEKRAVFGVKYTLKTALKWLFASPIPRGRSKPGKNIFLFLHF